jgi:hypothetical protein
MSWNITEMQEAVAHLTRSGAIGWLSRRPGSIEKQIARLRHRPDGSSPPDYTAAVDDLAAYGAYLAAFADAIRDKE